MRCKFRSLLAAMALTACTGQKPHNPLPDAGAVGDSDTGGITPQAFLEQLITAECAHAFSCMSQYPTTTGTTFADDWGTSQSDCLTTDDDYIARDQIAAAITAGHIAWDPASAMTCLGNPAFPASCVEFFTTYDWPDPCYDALSGNLADGAACTTGWECSGDMSDCVSGKCAPSTAVLAKRRR